MLFLLDKNYILKRLLIVAARDEFVSVAYFVLLFILLFFSSPTARGIWIFLYL